MIRPSGRVLWAPKSTNFLVTIATLSSGTINKPNSRSTFLWAMSAIKITRTPTPHPINGTRSRFILNSFHARVRHMNAVTRPGERRESQDSGVGLRRSSRCLPGGQVALHAAGDGEHRSLLAAYGVS